MTGQYFDITPFLDQDEGQHYDRKSLYEGPAGRKKQRGRRAVRDQVAEYVAAFANADGGVLALGIEDDRTLTGHRLPPDALQNLLNTPVQRLQPAQDAGFTVTVDGKELIIFDVPASDVPVQVIGNGFPLRMADSVVQSGEGQINALKFEGMAASWESRPAAAGLADLDAGLLEQARRGAGLAALSDAEYLLKRKLADRRGAGIALRNAAELLFARSGPEHPNAGVRLFRVIGTERGAGARYNVEERPRSEGNLPAVINAVSDTIAGLLRRPARLVGNRFRAAPEYPDFAWREALLNAVAHRDYAIEGGGIEITLFDDRMEVASPGRLMGGLTTADLLSLQRVHHSRNPRIVRVMVDLGFARDQGEGIPRMFAEMADAFLPNPDIKADNRQVTVTLYNTLTLSDADHDFVTRLELSELTRNELRALLHTHRSGRIDNASLRQLAGLETLSSSLVLRGLRDKNLLELHNLGSQSYYTLPPGLMPDLGELAADPGELMPDLGELAADPGELMPDLGELAADPGELTPDLGELPPDPGELVPDPGELVSDPGELVSDPACLAESIAGLGQRPRRGPLRAVIYSLCAQGRWMTSAELARLLNFSQGNLAAAHLGPMVDGGLLERRYPDNLTHPRQAYRAVGAAAEGTAL